MSVHVFKCICLFAHVWQSFSCVCMWKEALNGLFYHCPSCFLRQSLREPDWAGRHHDLPVSFPSPSNGPCTQCLGFKLRPSQLHSKHFTPEPFSSLVSQGEVEIEPVTLCILDNCFFYSQPVFLVQFAFHSSDKHHNQKQLRKERLSCLDHSSPLREAKAGTWNQELIEAEITEECSQRLAQFVPLYTLGPSAKGWHGLSGWALPTYIVNQEHALTYLLTGQSD